MNHEQLIEEREGMLTALEDLRPQAPDVTRSGVARTTALESSPTARFLSPSCAPCATHPFGASISASRPGLHDSSPTCP
jgi:hypothetical protein